MANSRELAEKAFSLLQDALRSSETRAAELDAELRKRRQPKNQVEKQVDVLAHRLETIETERDHWKREAAQLDEVLENERVKIRELKRKLTVAESGPDKLGKKEVNYWRSRVEQFDEETKQYKQRIADLKESLKGRVEAHEAPEPSDVDAARLETLQAELDRAASQRAELIARIEERDAELVALNAEIAKLEGRLASGETGTAELKTRNAELTSRIARFERDVEARETRANALGAKVAELERGIGKHGARAAELDGQIAEFERQIAERDAAAGKLSERIAAQDARTADLERRLEEQTAEAAALERRLQERDAEYAESESTLSRLQAQAATHNAVLAERDKRIVELAESQRQAEEGKRAIREQIAGLEDELKEEKECSVNLGELANERREKITELQERLDEAEERYEDAKWHLGRAKRFERLVVKRRKLVDSLIAGHRAKQKSNTALKAGIDGLRTYKARAEQQQQKLLMRVEQLTSQLREAEERLADQQSSKRAEDKLRKAAETISSLEDRVATQVELIENLENELSAVRTSRQSSDSHAKDFAELKTKLVELESALELRNETIVQLEADIDEQQEQLNKLRGSESETMRLTAMQEEDKSLIDQLQLEVDALRAELAQRHEPAEGGADGQPRAPAAEIRQRDSQISDLKRAIREKEKEIAKLNEAVAGWQKKYEFLSTEPPSAYQSAGEK